MKYANLFQPLQIAGVTIKNRIGMAPINNSQQIEPDTGCITQSCVDYFAERARGGTGLIITGVFKVENEIEKCINIKDNLYRWAELKNNSLRTVNELASRVHAYGGKVFMQLSAGPGRVTFPDVIASGVTPVSASPNQCYYAPDVTCRELTTAQVGQIVEAFGRAAKIAQAAGIDGIEVHGHEGYLIDQFTTALWNRRVDKYGGDARGRCTFPIEILHAIKAALGEDYPVTYRMGVRHFVRGPWKSALHEQQQEMGRSVEDSVEVAKILAGAGYDALSIDVGCYEGSYWAHPPYYHKHGFALALTAKIKEAVHVPVMVAGRLGIAQIASDAVAQGKTDMVLVGRDLLADPDWTNKVAAGQTEDIRPCLGCHDGCIQRTVLGSSILTCSVNPMCGRETYTHIHPAPKAKKILIAGGGVAGMECARMAAQRGHKVLLFEKSDSLGGHLREASAPDFKDDLKRLIAWYTRQLKQDNITIEMGVAVDEALVGQIAPDAMLVATGSALQLPNVPGIDSACVATCCELLLGKKRAGKRVVMIGGGLEGAETALWLAQQGHEIVIVDMLPTIGNGVLGANRTMLLDMLEDQQVKSIVNAKLHEVLDGGVRLLTRDMQVRDVACDSVVIATGMRPERGLYDAVRGMVAELYDAGDCRKPRKIHDAIWEAWNIGLTI